MKGYIKAVFLLIVCLGVLIPFASSDPDGLEKVAETLGIKETVQVESPMSDYSISFIDNGYFSTLIAGIFGILLVIGVALMMGRIIKESKE